MNSHQLQYYPRLKTVLSNEYWDEVNRLFHSHRVKRSLVVVNFYAVFIDTAVRKSSCPYTAFDIRNSESMLNIHLSALIGFIYTEADLSLANKAQIINCYRKSFSDFATRYNMVLQVIKISGMKISDDAQVCIELYLSKNYKSALGEYYSGWTCKDKEGKNHNVHLATFYDAYGEEFTSTIHTALANYIRTTKKETAKTVLKLLIQMLNEFVVHCSSLEALIDSLKAENSPAFMEKIFDSMLFKSLLDESSPQDFFLKWASRVGFFVKCFIDTNVFEEPIKPFLIPRFKTPTSDSHTISIGGDLSEKENSRWLVGIPLEIKDEEAVNIILNRLNNDLEHVKIISESLLKKIMQRHERNLNYIKTGLVKPVLINTYSNKNFPIGLDQIENTVATFYHHGFGVKGGGTASFLKTIDQTSDLIRELGLPTKNTLNVFISLLVLVHPKITPSWLNNWKLYDKNQKKTGFKQVGEQWLAVSFKNRKGAQNAQQEIVLNEASKYIVESLIEHTRFARKELQKAGGSDWRYVLLVANIQKPYRLGNTADAVQRQGDYHDALVVDSYDINRQVILTRNDAKELASLVSPRSLRKAKGLQIYLETHSLKAVAEALGHKMVDINLLESYLPKPLMDYFNKRWIRQFQNVIIFEALKESSYLFDALDFDEEKLEGFLDNHGVGNLPENLLLAGCCVGSEDNQARLDNLDELVFTLSKPLLQVLIAIQNIVENAAENEFFLPIIDKWYQSAVFILSHFTLNQEGIKFRRAPANTISLYESALNTPINLEVFKRNMLCR
jgi:hypothetical protein